MATSALLVAKRYSTALWASLDQASDAKNIATELKQSLETFQQPDLWRLMTSPTFSVAEKLLVSVSVLEKAGASKALRQFVEYLVKAGRINVLAEIVEAFEARVLESENTLEAMVETALPLSDSQKSEIALGLGKLFSKKINLKVIERTELIAGVRVLVQGQLIDGSLTSNFKKLEKNLLIESAVGA